MPNRVIREGWLDSHRIDELDDRSETFFLRLCLKADDFGRFHGSAQILKSMLYPMKESVRATDISRCLAACEKAGLVRCYEDSDSGKPYLEILRFDQRMRIQKSRFPEPPDRCQTDVGHLSDGCPLERKGIEKKRNEGANAPFASPEFAEVWRDWKAYSLTIHKPVGPIVEAQQWEKLKPLGEVRAIACIKATIANGWKTLNEEKRGEATGRKTLTSNDYNL